MHKEKAWWPLVRGLPPLPGTEGVECVDDVPHTTSRPNVRHLPFRVRVVRTYEHLQRAVAVRRDAYARHLPTLAEILAEAERSDQTAHSLVLLAESKETGEAVGTMRIATNTNSPVEFETALRLPSAYQGATIAHVARLGIRPGQESTLVKLALFKALHRYCFALQIDFMMVGAHPPMDRLYVQLGFADVYPDGQMHRIPSAPAYDVRIMSLEVKAVEREWRAQRHPMYSFLFEEYCPDIEIFNSVSSMWTRPRKAEVPAEPSRIN